MRPVDLAQVVRAWRPALQEIAHVLPDPIAVEAPDGRLLFGAADAGSSAVPIVSGGVTFGAVRGKEETAARVAKLLERFATDTTEKRALADETLGRYKELTLLYDTSEKLSRVLDLDDVAGLVVQEAKRFFHARGAQLMLVTPAGGGLEPLASAGDPIQGAAQGAAAKITSHVLSTGQAELVEDTDGGGSLMCAPLRTAESVFGLLLLQSEVGWTAGDLKLLTALAANTASALRRSLLHEKQLSEQALRSHVARFVPLAVLEAATEGRAVEEAIPVLVSDLRPLAAPRASELGTVLDVLAGALSLTLAVLMEKGATVKVPRGEEMLVALFAGQGSLKARAQAAVDAAIAVSRAIQTQVRPRIAPGIGIATAERSDRADGDPEAFHAGVSRAALLQASAEARILVDERIAIALAPELRTRPAGTDAFEVEL